jgi:transcriptional regulator with XRE-family HTH domain
MIVGERLRVLRESKNLSQGDVQKRTGLMRCYISRVENGHTVPAVETLYKFARALEVPMYRLFYEDPDTPGTPDHPSFAKLDDESVRGGRHATRFIHLLAAMTERNRQLLLSMARRMARDKRRSGAGAASSNGRGRKRHK